MLFARNLQDIAQPTVAQSDITTRFLERSEYDAWDALSRQSSTGCIFYETRYLDALCKAAGGAFRILGCFKGDDLHGGVTLYDRPTGGAFITDRPLLSYNGVVVRDFGSKYPSEARSRYVAVLVAIESSLRKLGYSAVDLKSTGLMDARAFIKNGWTARPYYTYVVAIQDIDGAWERVTPNFRRLIKRARKSGLQLVADTEFDAFFKLHEATHDRKGSPIYLPREGFRAFYETLHGFGMATLLHATLSDGQIVASQLVLTGEYSVAHTVCAGASAEHMKLGTTPFLRWSAFEWLSSAGYLTNDLTGAGLNEVSRFKSHLGSELVLNVAVSWVQRRAGLLRRLLKNR